MRSFGLRVLFGIGVVVATVFVAIPLFFRSLFRGARAFHASGTVCRAEVVALDDVVGPRLAGSARVRLSSVTFAENSPSASIIGMAIKLGSDQDLVVATFESFVKVNEGTRQTNVTDYLGNQYGSVTPWRARGQGVVWLRAIPDPASHIAKTGTRLERLDADIAAGRANFTIEAREAPGSEGAVTSKIAELRLVERLAADEPGFQISMFRTGRGVVPTGFRNGVRAVVYPVSRFARGLRGG